VDGLTASVALALLVVAGAGARPLLTAAISDYPSDPTTSTDATFVFSADARDAAFSCSLDGARAAPCTSPKAYGGLSLGQHKFVLTATRGREQASVSHTWTIVPSTPKIAHLVVSVIGGGTAGGDGIACPADCSKAFPIGTQVTLSAKPKDGFAFAGWHGACTGAGSCTASISDTTYVQARFERSVKPFAVVAQDADKDGVANAGDRCLSTPKAVKPLLYGCGLADLLNGGEALPSALEHYDYPGGHANRFDGIARLKPLHRALVTNLALARTGADQFEAGDVCGGAATMRRGVTGLRGSIGTSKKLIAAMQAAVLEKPGGSGDASTKELEWAGLHYRQGIVEEIAGEAAKVLKAFTAACASLGPPATLTGVVEDTDDAGGYLQLANGARVLLPDAQGDAEIAVGRPIRFTGRRAPGGQILAEAITALDDATFKPLALKPCSSLLIAPVQPFGNASPILHDPKGYEAQGMLRLEERMRIAASPEQCASKNQYRYSIKVEADAVGVQTKTIAPDLDYLDDPVPLDLGASPPKIWTLTVTYRRQGNNCPPGDTVPQPLVRAPASPAKSFPCPVQELGTQTYKARVRKFAAYAKAVYDKTVFDLESNAFVAAKVTGLTGVHQTLTSPSFEADGYAVVGNQSQGFHSKIVQNQLFAVWPEVWYGFPWLFPFDAIGVGHYAALVWPRVVGTRNGKPYRYAAQLPTLVTDLLPGCPASNCFYRLPWGDGEIEQVTQGNSTPITDPANPPSHCCPPQNFAFDLVFQDGETIYATRGGIVGDVVESNTMNFNPCVNGPSADGPSNFVRIDHPGGRYSYYAHVEANSVVPAEGSVVQRGAQLAKVGNVGRSCGPHLHYQVAIDSTSTIYGQTAQICFEGWEWVPITFTFHPCVVPQSGAFFMSTNG
jgi:murein DD-endopeptidase MepM/ murein hydrolase activator NlpD